MKQILLILILLGNLYGSSEATKTSELSAHTIIITGNRHIDTKELYDALNIEKRAFFAFWKDNKPKIKDRLIPSLHNTLESFYNSEGFYEAKFKIEQNSTSVYIDIEENRPVKITEIEIISDFPIKKLARFKKGEIFRAKKFVKTKNSIIKALLNEGYCSYDLDTKAYIERKKYSAKIKYRLKKGEYCIFGDTVIKGLDTIDADIVKSRVVAKKSERYNPKKIKESYARVYSLDAFDSILLSTNRKFYNEVPVDITLKELSKPYHYEIGAGYDTFVGARVHGMITKRNFFGNAQKITLRTMWSQREQLIDLDYFKPVLFKLFDYGIDFGANIGYSNLEFIGFKEKKSYMKMYMQTQEERLDIRMGMALENINISLVDNYKRNQRLLQAVKEGDFLLFYPFVNVVYDARDSRLNPKHGYYLSAYVEYGLPYGANASVYVKTLLEARVIDTFGDLTLSAVAKYAVVDIASNEIPESKLLFAGGSFFNRAYGYREIGVIDSATHDSIEGGLSMLNFSFEANYPLWQDIYGALFSDNTMITDKSYDFSGKYIYTAGVGLRYMTPIGPFKVDIGWNIYDKSQYGISFQIGQSF